MMLAPRYDGPTILSIAGPPDDQREPFTRQRLRMMAMLAELTDEQWAVPSRCDGWTTRDVVAHLVDVNTFWHSSIVAGLAGEPSRVLAGFDPATTPPLLVSWMSALGSSEVLEKFVATSQALLDDVGTMTDDGWEMSAESPAGHVPIRLVVQHALWDCWIHERDIAIPLGITPDVEADELRSCLQYAAAVSPVLGIGLGQAATSNIAVEASDPEIRFVLDVDESVSLGDEPAGDRPCLRGDALELTEALSLRTPMPSTTPAEWMRLLGGLETAFDSVRR
jgi:uncharacterized protein (TIGR03083 family)